VAAVDAELQKFMDQVIGRNRFNTGTEDRFASSIRAGGGADLQGVRIAYKGAVFTPTLSVFRLTEYNPADKVARLLLCSPPFTL
jgi:hypothetical protein